MPSSSVLNTCMGKATLLIRVVAHRLSTILGLMNLFIVYDAVLLAELLDVLVMVLEVMYEETKLLKLMVSWVKTNVKLSPGLLDDTVPSVHARGNWSYWKVQIPWYFSGSCKKATQKISLAMLWTRSIRLFGVVDVYTGRQRFECESLVLPILPYSYETRTLNSHLERRCNGLKCNPVVKVFFLQLNIYIECLRNHLRMCGFLMTRRRKKKDKEGKARWK